MQRAERSVQAATRSISTNRVESPEAHEAALTFPQFLGDSLAYDVAGLTRALPIGKTTVWALIKTGELRSFKARGRTLVSHAAVLDWIADQETKR